MTPAEAVVISIAAERAGAFEAADLFREGLVRKIVVADWPQPLSPVDIASWKLGVPRCLTPPETVRFILERSGVPPEAIAPLPEGVDGTGAEVGAVARFVRAERPRTLLFLTARSHTARAAWLLHRNLPESTRLSVRSPRTDTFDPGSWWTTRSRTRDVLNEYLHWIAALLPRDPWS